MASSASKLTLDTHGNTPDDLTRINLEVVQLLQRGAVPATIGIVYPDDASGSMMAASLHRQGLSYCMKQIVNLMDQTFIRKLMLLLNYLRAEHQHPSGGDELLFEILHFEWWGIPATDIAHLTMQVSEMRYRTGATLRSYLVTKLKEQPTDLFWQPLSTAFRKAITTLEALIAAVPQYSLRQLLDKAIATGGFLNDLQQQEEAGLQQQLDAFLAYVDTETAHNPAIDLEDLMHQLEQMRRQGQLLPLLYTSGEAGGVQLLPSQYYKEQGFEHLFWMGTAQEQATQRTTQPEWSNTPPERLAAELPAACSFAESSSPQPPEIARLDDAYETRAVSAFQMSVSALNNYLRCPLAFFYHNIVRIPLPRNEAMAFGSAVHHALELLFRKAQEYGPFPPETEFITYFEDYMHRHRENFSLAEYARRLAHGQTILRNYYRQYAGTWNTIVAVERTIRGVDLDAIPLKGKLDKIEFNGRQATIVDYKTGNVAYALKQMQRPNEQNPNGGDYWRQAVFYKLLVESLAGKDWQVAGVVFDFIEPDGQERYRREKVAVSPADEATVKEQIRTVWAKVQRHDFYTGCGKPGCHWCEFVQTHKLTLAKR